MDGKGEGGKGLNRLKKRRKELSCRVGTPGWAVWSVAYGRQSYETKKRPFLFFFLVWQ